MTKRFAVSALTWAVCAVLLVGCKDDSAVSSQPLVSSFTTTTTVWTEATPSTSSAMSAESTSSVTTTATSSTSATTTDEAPVQTTAKTEKSTTKATSSAKSTTTATSVATVTAKPTTATAKTTTTTTSKKTTTTTTVADPNRVTVNGTVRTVGDILHYTVMVKTAEDYGSVKIGVRCVQKGLEIPEGTFQKQNQAVMKNIGIGRWGTMPEETVEKNGFTMTANKGYALDAAYDGYSGLLWYYETTAYDFNSQSDKRIDCSKGVALFTIALKITKPGDYLVECMEYPSHSRADLTVWGEFV